MAEQHLEQKNNSKIYSNYGSLNYKDTIFESLPYNSKKYHIESNKQEIDNIVSKYSVGEEICRIISLLKIIPIFSLKYIYDNELILMLKNGSYKIYKGPGWFSNTNLTDTIIKIVEIGENFVHGPIKVIYVNPGTLRYGLNIAESKPMLLGPGMHYFNDINIVINDKIINLNTDTENKIIPLDDNKAFNLIFVKTGFNGVVNERNGELEILQPGIHFCESPDTFKTFVSVQQETLKFGSTTSNQHKFLTMDNIELSIDATLFYKVVDVKKVFTTNITDNKDLTNTLLTQARSMLMTLIRSENFSNIGQKKMNRQMNTNISEQMFENDRKNINLAIATPINVEPSAPLINENYANNANIVEASVGFDSIIKDIEPQFKKMMQENFGDNLGFEIQYLRIENIEFADKKMQNRISELSMEFTKLTAHEATINIQRRVEIADAERISQTKIIDSESQARIKIINANAENEIIKNKNNTDNEIKFQNNKIQNEILLSETEAKIKSSELIVNTEAKNKIILANAEAETLEKVGNVQYELNKKNAELPHTQVRIIAEAQRDALAGVNKVIYTNEQSMLLKPYMNLIEKDI